MIAIGQNVVLVSRFDYIWYMFSKWSKSV